MKAVSQSNAIIRLLAAIPSWAYQPLRKLRTAALVVAEPFDLLHRKLTGRSNLPPLWLRRHVGPVSAYERAPGEISAIIALRSLADARSRVLDIGCGSGAMASEFARFLEPQGRYVGFDVHRASIRWCRSRFAGDERFAFELARVATPYSAEFDAPAAQYAFPSPDGSVDFALAKSLFTHLLEAEARQYLREIARVLTTHGRALLTLYLPRDSRETMLESARFQFRFGGPDVWTMVRAKPTALVAYRLGYFELMLRDAGLAIDEMIDGDWRGPRLAPNAQDVLIVRRVP